MQTRQPTRRRRVLRRYGAADRERLVQAQAQSGLTIQAFCKREGLRPTTFYGWSRKRRVAVVKAPPRFAEVEVAPCLAAAVEVLLPNGTRIGIRHQGQREELVALVRGVAGC